MTPKSQAQELYFVRKLTERVIVTFLDFIILSQLMTRPLSGYDIMNYIRKKHNFLLSPGTIYSTLYAMERKGLIEGSYQGKKRLYTITKTGVDMTISIKNSKKFRDFLFKIMEPDENAVMLSQKLPENGCYAQISLERKT